MSNFLTTTNDNGGVHTNSGITNKVAYLLGHGGTHRGLIVRQIGRAKVQRIWYDVLTTRLGPSSQFIDMRNEVVNETREFWRQGRYGFASADICDVINAFASVGLGAGDLDCDGVDDLEDEDTDGDRIPNSRDNCPTIPNWNQFDLDHDGVGDECDPDDDGVGVPDIFDNAPYTYNPDQADSDFDGRGNVIDDSDNDGILDIYDNCPLIPNRDQLDNDGDGIGDVCDADDDNDGVPDAQDNARFVPNPDQRDTDGDGVGDAVDCCPTVPNPNQANHDGDAFGDACDSDDDNDGIPDSLDNCPTTFNPDQQDLNHNGIGYACDPNEQIAYPRFDARRFQAQFKFFTSVRVLRFPIDIGPGDPGDPLPEDFVGEMLVSLPAGVTARIVDDEGFVVARNDATGERAMRFRPRSDWSYVPPSADAAGFALAVAGTGPYRGASYTLELIRGAGVPTGVNLSATIQTSTALASAPRLELKIVNQRAVLTITDAAEREYRLETSTNLTSWSSLLSTSSADGIIIYTSPGTVSGQRFYRAVLVP